MKKLTNLSEFINSNASNLIKGGAVNIGGTTYYPSKLTGEVHKCIGDDSYVPNQDKTGWVLADCD